MPPTPSSRLLELPDVGGVGGLGEPELLDLQTRIGAVRREVDAAFAVVARELAHRSDIEQGYSGLAQRTGDRTPERLISRLTGLSTAESRAMVTAGEALVTVESGETPWLAVVTSGLAAGEVTVGSAAAIRTGLGDPNDHVDADELARAAMRLAAESQSLPPEKVAQRARQARDELDVAGVADREAALRATRSLRVSQLADGRVRAVLMLDPENGALFVNVIDRFTSPRRGGVRFVDPAEKRRSAAIVDDDRPTDVLALDGFMQLVRLAVAADDGRLLGNKAPSVRVHVKLSDLQRGVGVAYAEGQPEGLSIGTVHRMICEGGVVPILFDDDGRAMNVGRAQRLHTDRQREAIKARDGGCLIPGCDRPPSWVEIHHPEEWDADHGETSVANGVCLCRFDHAWVHDSGAKIVAEGAGFVLVMPDGECIDLPSKSPLRRAS